MSTKIETQLEAARIQAIVSQAMMAAREAAEAYFKNNLAGRDCFPCGFAWVRITGVKGNTKLGKALKDCGFSKAYAGGMEIWNPSGLPVQNVDVKLAGAEAFANLLIKKLNLPEGFKILAECRLD